MRSLFNILESIADSDEEVLAKQFAQSTLPVYITDIYHEIFGEVIEPSSNVIRIDKWYTSGYINGEHIDIDDYRGTCKNMRKWVKEFEKKLKQKCKGYDVDIQIKITQDKFQEAVTWKAYISVRCAGEDYTFSLTVEGYTNNNVRHGVIWTTSDKIDQLL